MVVVAMVVAVAVEDAAAGLVVASAERGKNRGPPPPHEAEPGQQLFHGSIVGHEELAAIQGERKVTIADFERRPYRLVGATRRDREHWLRPGLDLEKPLRLDRNDVAGP